MLQWPHLVLLGFLLFAVVTLYVATLELTLSSLRTLGTIAAATYGAGVLGVALAFTRVGAPGRLLAVLIVGLGTGGLAILAIFPRVSVGELIPFLP